MKSYICHYGDKLTFRPLMDDYELIDLEQHPDYEFIPGNRYLIYGPEAYKVITQVQKIHLGPRREGFYDLTKMDYLQTRSGVIFKFSYVNYDVQQQWIEQKQYEAMLANLGEIQKKIRGARLREVYSKKKDRYYWIFEFNVLAPLNNDLKNFLSKDDYIKPAPTVRYYEIVREKDDMIGWFNYFTDQPLGRRFGYDFETCHGFPFDSEDFSPMGLGIADLDGYAAYFDIEYIRDFTDYYDLFVELLIKFLDKHAIEVYAYNVGFELRVTYIITKKMYPLQDSAAINKLEGDVEYNLTLKYTAMRHCYVASWDDDFEASQDLLATIMNSPGLHFGQDTYDDTQAIQTIDNYDQCPAWFTLNTKYPGMESEFRRLIKKSWGDPFGAIPSPLLGKYCCMDAYYTLLIRERSDQLGYTDDAWKCFSSNLRLGAHLNINGVFIDRPLQIKMRNQGHVITGFGALNIAKWYIHNELKKYDDVKIPECPYGKEVLKLGVNPFDFKEILRWFADDSPSGINEERLLECVGPEVYTWIIQALNDYGRYPMDKGIFRSKSVFNHMFDLVKTGYNYKDFGNEISLTINGVEYFMPYDMSRLMRKYGLLNRQVEIDYLLDQVDIFNPQSTYKDYYGNDVPVENLMVIGTNVYNLFSSQVAEDFYIDSYWQYFNLAQACYFSDSSFVDYFEDPSKTPELTRKRWRMLRKAPINSVAGMEYIQVFLSQAKDRLVKFLKSQLADESLDENSDAKKRSKWILDAFDRYDSDGNFYRLCYTLMASWDYLVNEGSLYMPRVGEGLSKFVSQRDKTLHAILNEGLKRISASYEENAKWATIGLVYESVDNVEVDGFRDQFIVDLPKYDVTEFSYKGLAKLAFCFRSMKKYSKILGTYIDGMLVDTARYCKEYDENGVSIGRWDNSGPCYKAFPRYDVCAKKSKRWASNFHTIPSGNECKRIVTAPKGFLMSYFDISGMEVRTLSYLANDQFMINNYNRGVDPYIDLAQMVYPGKEMWFYKQIRADMKTTLLGSLYGMGVAMMAERTGQSVQDAQNLLDVMFKHMSGIQKLIEHKGNYPFEHNGYVETILGDKISLSREPQDRWSRLGNNLCIQGGSAVLMADAFENIIQTSYTTNEIIVRPLNVVHDSSQNYFESSKIFSVCQFYNKHMRKYLYDKYKIDYAFDTLVGANYFDMCVLTPQDEHTIELEGDCTALTKILDRLDEDNVHYRILSLVSKKGVDCFVDGKVTSDFKRKTNSNIIDGFYRNGYAAVWDLDFSNYKLVISNQ